MKEGEIAMKDQLYETPKVFIYRMDPRDILTLSDNDMNWNDDWYDDDDDLFDGEIYT